MIDLTHTKVEEFIMTVQTPYRYDVVGSFLRPEKLKQARKDYGSKKICLAQDDFVGINKSKRNEELFKYMKSIHMIKDYLTTSKQIFLYLLINLKL